jgi:hypothetical protein
LGDGSSLRFGNQVRCKGKPHRQHICVCSRIVYFPSTELRILGEHESPVKVLGRKAYQVQRGSSARQSNAAWP